MNRDHSIINNGTHWHFLHEMQGDGDITSGIFLPQNAPPESNHGEHQASPN